MSEAVRKSTNSAVGNSVSSTAAKLNVWIIARLSDVFRVPLVLAAFLLRWRRMLSLSGKFSHTHD